MIILWSSGGKIKGERQEKHWLAFVSGKADNIQETEEL